MEYLIFDKTKANQSFFSFILSDLEEVLKEAIEVSNVIQKAINEKDYANYYKLAELSDYLNGYVKRIYSDSNHLTFTEEKREGLLFYEKFYSSSRNATAIYYRRMIKELKTRFNYFKSTITNIINFGDGANLGKLSEIFDDLEDCMKYQNFYDFFFLAKEAEIEIKKLDTYEYVSTSHRYRGRYIEVDKGKRKLIKKLHYCRNLVAQHHPEAIELWEKIRHNLSLANTQERMENLHEELVEANKVQAAATMVQAESLVEAAADLKVSKNLQIVNTGINAYEALQARKARKKLEE